MREVTARTGEMASDGSARPFVENIQVLRFVAAFMVLLSHARHEAAASAGDLVPAFAAPFNLVTGVDIFFVISGFVMFYLGHDRFGRAGEPARFLLRRAIRLVPTYWLFTALMLGASFVFHDQLAKPDIGLAHLLASLVFIPWPDQAGALYPPLMLGWTLNYEALFYVLFAGALALPRRAGLGALAAVLVFAAAAHVVVPAQMQILRFWSDPIVLEFLMGIALAALYLAGVRLGVAAGLAVTFAGFALLSFFYMAGWQPPAWRFVWAGLPALIICGGLALSERCTRRAKAYDFVVLCGSASYALYLSHLFTVKLIGVIWRKLALGLPWAMLAVTSVTAVLVSLLVYAVIEKPLIAWLNRSLAPRRAPEAAAAALPRPMA